MRFFVAAALGAAVIATPIAGNAADYGIYCRERASLEYDFSRSATDGKILPTLSRGQPTLVGVACIAGTKDIFRLRNYPGTFESVEEVRSAISQILDIADQLAQK